MRPLFAFIVALLLVASVPAVVAAQEEAEHELPEGVTLEVLAQAVADELPPVPAAVGLFRVTFAPGAAEPVQALPGPLLGYVESGTVALQAEGPLTVTRAAAMGTPGPQEETTPGAEVMVGAGDSVFVPAGTVHTARNAGAEPAIALLLEIGPAEGEPAATSEEDGTPADEEAMAGITVQPLVYGVAAAVPAGPTVMGLARLTLAPGASAPPEEPHPGPELIAVEAGTAAVTIIDGEILILRGVGMATPGAEPGPAAAAAVGTEITVEAGDAIFAQTGSVETARNDGDVPAVALVVFVAPAAEPATATPAP